MNPNDNQQPTPGNYLDQIAPQAAHGKMDFMNNKPILIGGIALGALILLTIIAMIFSALGSNVAPVERFAARLTTIQSTVDLATPNIKSTKLRALNSNLKIFLTNTIRDATPILAAKNVVIAKIDKKVLAAESNATTLATLEDARLNGEYDRTYAREMAYQLEKLLTLTRQIFNSTSSQSFKDFLDSSYKNLEPTQKQFSDYNAANS